MGEISDRHVENFASGKWGIPIRQPRVYPKTSRANIADHRFSIVEVKGGKTNRIPGTKLVVCSRDAKFYWVWSSTGVTGILKDVCTVLHEDLELNSALKKAGRKPYGLQKEANPKSM